MTDARKFVEGLSPRARGNHGGADRGAAGARSIPASAGEPRRPTSRGPRPTVYPRERGGTVLSFPPDTDTTGLSPRARGNLGGERRPFFAVGSIPASAGEPPPHDDRQECLGSIPASAGEPPASWPGSVTSGVYPRERGGTDRRETAGRAAEGLSPRARGNHDTTCRTRSSTRSIPASAGEPWLIATSSRSAKVYPRERGGTEVGEWFAGRQWGLSPRARGNPQRRHREERTDGSIPASAGEPAPRPPAPAAPAVYPRERGGTRQRPGAHSRKRGLSPRARGNRARRRPGHDRLGSIPASAGEPPPLVSQEMIRKVYPRERGGTPSLQQLDPTGMLKNGGCLSVVYKVLTSSTPSASRISFGGSPR